jgi:hypothetical protein
LQRCRYHVLTRMCEAAGLKSTISESPLTG